MLRARIDIGCREEISARGLRVRLRALRLSLPPSQAEKHDLTYKNTTPPIRTPNTMSDDHERDMPIEVDLCA